MELLYNRPLPRFLTHPDPEVLKSDNYVVFDFETTNLDKGSALNAGNSVVSVAWTLGPAHPYYQGQGNMEYRRAGEYELHELIGAIHQADYCVAHNAKFDLQWAERCGLDLTDVLVYDTMIAEYVIGGNKWVWHQLSLNTVAKRRGFPGKIDVVSAQIKAGVPTEDIPEAWLEYYCKVDVELTREVMLQQREDLTNLNLWKVLYSRSLLTPVLADIEKNGVQMDTDMVGRMLTKTENEYGRLLAELEQFTGGVDLGSRKELSEYLYVTLGIPEKQTKTRGQWVTAKTPGGEPKTDADTIAALRPQNKKQAEFLGKFASMKEKYNELTKYLRKFGECAVNDGGLLFAGFNQTSTRTHRLSSTGRAYSTQLHNIPRAYKPIFRARNDGWLVGEADGAQLEFRVAAHLGRCAAAIRDIVAGTDIHSVTASIIGVSRQEAKAHTFKPLYGGKSGTVDEVRYYEHFREVYPGITATQQGWIDQVLEDKYLTTEWGLRYYWPGTRMERSGYVLNSTAICNYPVQAFATAEIIPLALVWFWHRLKRTDLRMIIVNTVHDSIIAEFPPEETEAFHELSKQSLIDDVYRSLWDLYGIRFVVPLAAGVKAGTHWNGPDCSEHVPDGVDHDKGEVVYTAEDSLWHVE